MATNDRNNVDTALAAILEEFKLMRETQSQILKRMQNVQIRQNPRQRAGPRSVEPVGRGVNHPRDPPARNGLDSDSDEEDKPIRRNGERYSKIIADLPFFTGDLDLEDFLDWLGEVEKYFELMEIARDKQVQCVAYKLRSEASSWWEQLQNIRRRQGKKPIRTWKCMKEALRIRFLPADYDEKLFQKYRDCQQGNSYESDSSSITIQISDKVLVPDTTSDDSLSSTDEPAVYKELDQLPMEEQIVGEESISFELSVDHKIEDEENCIPSHLVNVENNLQGVETFVHLLTDESEKTFETTQKSIRSPDTGQKIYELNPYLEVYRARLDYRFQQYKKTGGDIDKYEGGLEFFSRDYEKLGFNCSATGITYRESLTGAKPTSLIGDFNNWNFNANVLTRSTFGLLDVFLPNNGDSLSPILHSSWVKIDMDTPSGIKDSIPARIRAPDEIPYNGIYYNPPKDKLYTFNHPQPKMPESLRIYEARVGMSSTEPKINIFAEFRDDVLTCIDGLGYNVVQLMVVQEHSYYDSFGHNVTNVFAPSSRCGTPDDLKSWIDKSHELGVLILMDRVQSHASNNVLDGLNMFDRKDGQYFDSGARNYHWMWDSRLFNNGTWEVHTESTYVQLFNPKVVMSVENDRKTTIWDIWKGSSFHIYDPGGFKLLLAKGDLLMVHLRNERFPVGMYNKLQLKKIEHCKILRKINDNAYVVDLSNGWDSSLTFNVADLVKFFRNTLLYSNEASRASPFQARVTDAGQD